MKRILATLFFVLAPFTAQAQISAPSTWVNDKGSILTIESIDTGHNTFTGKFVNNAPKFYCKGTPYDVSGNMKGNSVNFAVVFKNMTADCQTITIWRGKVAGTSMPTKWKLVYVDGGSFQRMSGADLFSKQ